MKNKITKIIVPIFIFSLMFTACGANSSSGSDNSQENKGEQEVHFLTPEEAPDLFVYDEGQGLHTADTIPEDELSEDYDADGLTNSEEISHGTNMYSPDTDNDGLSDYDELMVYKTDPNMTSTFDNGLTDLEHVIVNVEEFKEGYTQPDNNDFIFYLTKPEDKLYRISKAATDVFNDLYTVTEAFKVNAFTGKMGIKLDKYDVTLLDVVSVYKADGDSYVPVEINIDKDNQIVEFQIQDNDVFVIVYENNM